MFEKLMSDAQVQQRYAEAGRIFGDAVSYLYMGECIGFKGLHKSWAKWEAEYARRGYQTLSVDDFVAYGGYGEPLKNLGTKRVEGEKVVLHAEIYREVYLGKMQPAVNLAETMKGKVQMGTYITPSTKEKENEQ